MLKEIIFEVFKQRSVDAGLKLISEIHKLLWRGEAKLLCLRHILESHSHLRDIYHFQNFVLINLENRHY